MIHFTKKDHCWHTSVILNCQASLPKYKLAELTFRKCKTGYSWRWIRAFADSSHLVADVRDNEFNLRREGGVWGGGLPACPAVTSHNSLEGIGIVNWNSICLTVILASGLELFACCKEPWERLHRAWRWKQSEIKTIKYKHQDTAVHTASELREIYRLKCIWHPLCILAWKFGMLSWLQTSSLQYFSLLLQRTHYHRLFSEKQIRFNARHTEEVRSKAKSNQNRQNLVIS